MQACLDPGGYVLEMLSQLGLFFFFSTDHLQFKLLEGKKKSAKKYLEAVDISKNLASIGNLLFLNKSSLLTFGPNSG